MINGGILLVNKKSGFSSQKIDTIVKKTKAYQKVGHLGTLDPLADGLLVLLIDDATKYAKYFNEDRKTYRVRIVIGEESPSLDRETEVTKKVRADLSHQEEYIDNILKSFIGENIQQTPLYSAVKIKGNPLYKYARKNQEIELPERRVNLFSIKREGQISTNDDTSYITFVAEVSKGFFIRELARQIGEKINLPAMCESITRLTVGSFNIDKACTLEDIENDKYSLLNPDEYIEGKKVIIDEKLEKKVLNGVRFAGETFSEKGLIKLYSLSNELLAYYLYDDKEEIYKLDLMVKK